MTGAPEPQFETVAIVGMGLMGGSLGQALRQRHMAGRVIALVRRESAIQEVAAAEAADVATLDWGAVRDADLVVLTPPILSTAPVVAKLAPHLRAGALVTDVGSTKALVMEQIPPLLPDGVGFIGGHPMAGSERSGIGAARPDLFEGATWVLTRGQGSGEEHWRRLWAWVEQIGAEPVEMEAKLHDAVAARISHLPHVVAAALASAGAQGAEREWLSLMLAGGFRDTTRIAGSSPQMWRDISLANRDSLEQALNDFEQRLRAFRTALKEQDGDVLYTWFEAARKARAGLLADRSPLDPRASKQ